MAPHECLSCGQEGLLVCGLCAPEVFEEVPDRCYRCLAMSMDSAVCIKCRRTSPLKHVWVATEYDGISKRLVSLMKFDRAKAAAQPIASHMASTLPYLDTSIIVTHLPTATARQRSRGYDQSELIARKIARLKEVKYSPLLLRRGQGRQVGASRQQRIKQATGMFLPFKPQSIKGAHILLVDDILTTGASLESAAKTLKLAGAKQVDAIVFAQKH